MVHLAVPDHSRKFWLTVQTLCPDTERARQWLVANGPRIQLKEPGAAICDPSVFRLHQTV